MTTLDVETISTFQDDEGEIAVTASHIEVIETVIAGMQENDSAMVSHTEDGHLWKFHYGSVDVFVQLTGNTDDDVLSVWSPVLNLPVQNEPDLMRELLQMNCGETLEACFGILNKAIVILASRTLADINPSEISRLMTIVATIADEQDDKLKAKYPAV